MRIIDFVTVLVVSSLGGLVLFATSMKLIPAVGLATFLLMFGLSMINYLNHGKFHPFVPFTLH